MHPNMPCTFLYDIALSCSLEKCNCMAPMACWGGPDTFRRKHCTELGSVTELALHFAEQGVSGLAVPNYETSLVSEGGAYFCGTGEEQRGLRQPGAPGGLCAPVRGPGAHAHVRADAARAGGRRPPRARARGGRRCAFKPPAVRLIWLPVPQHHQCCRTPCARARVRTAVRGVPCHAPDPAVWGATPPVLPLRATAPTMHVCDTMSGPGANRSYQEAAMPLTKAAGWAGTVSCRPKDSNHRDRSQAGKSLPYVWQVQARRTKRKARRSCGGSGWRTCSTRWTPT